MNRHLRRYALPALAALVLGCEDKPSGPGSSTSPTTPAQNPQAKKVGRKEANSGQPSLAPLKD